MVVHHALPGCRCKSKNSEGIERSDIYTEQNCKSNNEVNDNWWAAQVASNKEYDTKREIINMCVLKEENILIPRKMVYDVKNDKVDKKTEIVLPGYILLRLGNEKMMRGLESMKNYISILGRISREEMEVVKEFENIPKETNAHEGDKIIITKGAFAGVKGIIVEKHDNAYCKCRLLFQGNEIVTDMDPRIVERIA